MEAEETLENIGIHTEDWRDSVEIRVETWLKLIALRKWAEEYLLSEDIPEHTHHELQAILRGDNDG